VSSQSQQSRILVTCPKACPPYLQAELESLGYGVSESVSNGVFTRGNYGDCMLLNLQLYTGLRVLWEVGRFKARDADSLYRRAKSLPWEDWIHEDGYFSIHSSVRNDSVDHSHYPNLRLKDAIVDRIRQLTGSRPDSGNERDHAVVFLYWREQEVCIYLDTSGIPISNRGYRAMPGCAPLRENLAASIIRATRWDRASPFVNPMCGSGTLAIEAALAASEMLPQGRRGEFAFRHFKPYDGQAFERILKERRKKAPSRLAFPIVASDVDPMAIRAAKSNAEAAGVAHLIDFHCCDFRESPIPGEAGTIALNPEYGERLGEQRQLEPIYAAIGDLFKKKCPGYWGYVFTGNRQLGKCVGLKTRRKIEFYNGPIECRLLEYELYKGSRQSVPKS